MAFQVVNPYILAGQHIRDRYPSKPLAKIASGSGAQS
jgi:hypothetical protein